MLWTFGVEWTRDQWRSYAYLLSNCKEHISHFRIFLVNICFNNVFFVGLPIFLPIIIFFQLFQHQKIKRNWSLNELVFVFKHVSKKCHRSTTKPRNYKGSYNVNIDNLQKHRPTGSHSAYFKFLQVKKYACDPV